MQAEITADFVLPEDGEVWTIDTLITHLAPLQGKKVKRVNSFRFHKTGQQGNQAWTYYHNTAHVSFTDKKGPLNWLESAVLCKEEGQWKIVLLHSTVKPKK